MESATTTEPATAESARPSDAGEAAVALHARRTTVVITAEDTMIIRVAALLKAFISETLLRRGLAAIKAPGPAAAKSAFAAIAREPVGHSTIAIWHAHAVSRIVCPRRSAQPPSVEIPEPKTIEERTVDEYTSAEPVGAPSPTAPSPATPSAKIETKIYTGKK